MTIKTRNQTENLTFTVLERAVLYARTSGDDSDRDSLSDQIAICEGFATGKQYQIVTRLQEDVSGVSGANWDAPKLNEALALAQAGAFDVLIVRDVKRFSRDIEKAVTFDGQFNRHGVRIEYVWNPELNGRVDATTKLLKLIRYWEGESDRIDTVKRLYNGRKKAVRQKGSVLVSKCPPYGYRVETDYPGTAAAVNRLIVDGTEAIWVKRIFEWFTVEKLSYQKIVRRLAEYEVPTPSEAAHRQTRRQKKFGRYDWWPTTLKQVLQNTTYAGQWRYAKDTQLLRKNRRNSVIPGDLLQEPVSVEVPAIIDAATFALAQQRMKDIMGLVPAKHTTREFLMQGRMTCGHCGSAITVKGLRLDSGEYLYYRCRLCNHTHKTQLCDLPTFRASVLDGKMWAWVRELLLEEQGIENSYRKEIERAKEQNGPITDRIHQIDAEIAEHEGELASQQRTLKDLPPAAHRSRATTMHDIERLEALLDRLEGRRNELQGQVKAPEDIAARFATLRQFRADLQEGAELAENDFNARRQIIEALNVTAVLRMEDGRKTVDARAEFDEVVQKTFSLAGNSIGVIID